MQLVRLFDHPVGTMPARARWYLAISGIVLTVLIGAHFAVQADVQRATEQALLQWGAQAGVKVRHVRYRLLRNALTLADVHLRMPGLDVEFGHVLLKLVPAALQDGRLEIVSARLVRMRGQWRLAPDARWPGGLDRLRVHRLAAQGQLEIQRDSAKAKVENVRITVEDGRWRFSGRAGGGRVLGAGDIRHGRLEWSQAPAGPWFGLAGLQPPEGRWSGQLLWSDEAQPHLLADARWQGTTGEQGELHARLQRQSEGWQADVRVQGWPVHGLQAELAPLGRFRIRQAWLQGSLQGRQGADGWRFDGGAGALQRIRLSFGGDADWRIGRLAWERWQAQEGRRALNVDGLELADVEAFVADLRPRSPHSDAWRPTFKDARIAGLRLHWRLATGELGFPPARGTLRLEGGQFGLMLEAEADEGESWQLHGAGALDDAGALPALELRLRGDGVAARKLRPLWQLAVPGLDAVPLALDGIARLDWRILWAPDGVAIEGETELRDAIARYGSEQWQAKRLHARFQVDGDIRRVLQLEGSAWRYLAPMAPMRGSAERGEVAEPGPWLQLLRAGRWHLEHVRLTDGTVALGQPDQAWATDLQLEITDLAPGARARLRLSGLLGEGRLEAELSGRPYEHPLRWQGKVHVRDGLPFFLHSWMRLSGLPVLVRGRWSWDLDVRDKDDGYDVRARLGLQRPRWLEAVATDDPLLQRTGYPATTVLAWLGRRASGLEWAFAGRWAEHPLDWQAIVEGGLEAIRAAKPVVPEQAAEQVKQTAQVRLHERAGLTRNERHRLYRLIRRVRANPGWVLELRPEIAGERLDALAIRRIRTTQRLLEEFAVKLGLERERIFPVWPRGGDEGPEVGGVRVLAIAPASK